MIANPRVLLFCFIAALLSWGSCSSEADDFQMDDADRAYFPLQIGDQRMYQVDSTVYDFIANDIVSISSTHLVRETVVDTFRDQNQALWYRLSRDTRTDTTEWTVAVQFAARMEQNRLLILDDNLERVQLVFPIAPRKNWDPTVAIPEGTNVVIAGEPVDYFKYWEARYLEVNEPYSLDGKDYAETVLVEYADFETVIDKRVVFDRYAKDIGLIERTMVILDTQDTDTTLPFEERAERGFIVHMGMVN